MNPAFTEPFGLTLIEAAACALPIVATEDGGPQDIVANCGNGILDPGEAGDDAGQPANCEVGGTNYWLVFEDESTELEEPDRELRMIDAVEQAKIALSTVRFAAIALQGWEGVTLFTLATDGTDGPTDAAGAVVDGRTVARARALGLSAADALADNDSYHFFDRLGDLIRTGPTNTNVNDLLFVIAP